MTTLVIVSISVSVCLFLQPEYFLSPIFPFINPINIPRTFIIYIHLPVSFSRNIFYRFLSNIFTYISINTKIHHNKSQQFQYIKKNGGRESRGELDIRESVPEL